MTKQVVNRRQVIRGALASALVLPFSSIPLSDAFAAKAKPVPSFFNTVEVRSKNLKPFKKWRAALSRYAKESKANVQLECMCTG